MIQDGSRAVLAWVATYTDHLQVGVQALEGGEPLTQAFARRCQELDDSLRALGGDALREAAASRAGRELLAELADTQARFGSLARVQAARLSEGLGGVSRGRSGLRGYVRAGQDLKTTGGFYVDRTL